MILSVLPVQLDSVGLNCVCTLVSLLAELLYAHTATGYLPSLTSTPLLKESLCGSHTAEPQHRALGQFSEHCSSPKSTKSLSVRGIHSLPLPVTVLGESFSLELSKLVLQLWTCCLLCVYSLSLPDFVYTSKSLLIRVGGFPVRDQGLALGWQVATKVCFLSVVSSAAGTVHRIFPLQLTKSLSGQGKASSVVCGFRNSYQLRFC